MSKIEEALKKSNIDRGQDIVKYQDAGSLIGNADLALMPRGIPVDNITLSKYKIIHPNMEDIKILNEFRSIRTELLKQFNQKNACFMVFSTMNGGGASYTAINIAASIALDLEKTALVLSCDFNNKPDYENLVDDKAPRLFDYLSGTASVEQIIHSVGIDRLRVVPSSTSECSFAEYFSTSKFKHLIEEITTRYHDRFIIIDAPSANDEANIKLLEEYADYVILVAPSGKSKMQEINKAKRLISHDKTMGVIINDIPQIVKQFK